MSQTHRSTSTVKVNWKLWLYRYRVSKYGNAVGFSSILRQKQFFSVCSESCINKRHNIVSRITSLLTVYSILTSQPTANIILPKQLFCSPTSTITSSVQYDHRKYHVFAYSTSLLLLTVTLLTTTSWSPVSHAGLVSMALFSAGSSHICHLVASVSNVPGTYPHAVSPNALSLVYYSSSCTPLLSVL